MKRLKFDSSFFPAMKLFLQVPDVNTGTILYLQQRIWHNTIVHIAQSANLQGLWLLVQLNLKNLIH